MYGHKETKKIVFLSTHLYSNVLFQSVFVIYMNSNTSIMFIKKKDFLKKITTSHVQKDIYIYIFSPPICIQIFDFYMYLLSI